MKTKDSLIKSFSVEETDRIPKFKITFIVVNDKKLVYYTNSEDFTKTLESFKDKRFIIEYSLAELSKNTGVSEDETKIVRTKLPKKPI